MAWRSLRVGWLVAAGLANTLLMLCLVSNVAIIAALFGHSVILGLSPAALAAFQRGRWSWHVAVTLGGVGLACLIELFFLPFILASLVIHGNQGAGVSFARMAAALLTEAVPLRGGDVFELPALPVAAIAIGSMGWGLIYGVPRLSRQSASAVVALSLVVGCVVAAVYLSRSPVRALVPAHAVAVVLVVWSIDVGFAALMRFWSDQMRFPRFILIVSGSAIVLLLMSGGGWLSVKRTSPEPVFETISLAESLARGRPIWSTGSLRDQDWNGYYASRPIAFRTSLPEEDSVFLMLLSGHARTPEDRHAIEIVRRFGRRAGRVAPGFEVWECPPQRAIDEMKVDSTPREEPGGRT
jgi:hypothetical protein